MRAQPTSRTRPCQPLNTPAIWVLPVLHSTSTFISYQIISSILLPLERFMVFNLHPVTCAWFLVHILSSLLAENWPCWYCGACLSLPSAPFFYCFDMNCLRMVIYWFSFSIYNRLFPPPYIRSISFHFTPNLLLCLPTAFLNMRIFIATINLIQHCKSAFFRFPDSLLFPDPVKFSRIATK